MLIFKIPLSTGLAVNFWPSSY